MSQFRFLLTILSFTFILFMNSAAAVEKSLSKSNDLIAPDILKYAFPKSNIASLNNILKLKRPKSVHPAIEWYFDNFSLVVWPGESKIDSTNVEIQRDSKRYLNIPGTAVNLGKDSFGEMYAKLKADPKFKHITYMDCADRENPVISYLAWYRPQKPEDGKVIWFHFYEQ